MSVLQTTHAKPEGKLSFCRMEKCATPCWKKRGNSNRRFPLMTNCLTKVGVEVTCQRVTQSKKERYAIRDVSDSWPNGYHHC